MNENEFQKHQPPQQHRPGEWDQFTRQAALVILLLSVLLLIAILRPVINLLSITGIVILVLSYPVNKLRMKTNLAYPITVLLVFIPLAVLLFLLISQITGWFVDNLQSLTSSLNGKYDLNRDAIAAFDKALGGSFPFSQLVKDLFAVVSKQLIWVSRFVSFSAISFFLAFLFILEMPANLARSFQSLSDVSQHEFGILIDRLSNVWNGWLRSTVITACIIGASTSLELFLFGIPYAGILGVLIGFLNLIPTFGALVSYLLIIIVTYTHGSSYLTLIPLTLTFLVWVINVLMNQIVRLVIFPKLAGKSTHLPVFLVILGLVVAAVLWGVIGVILIVPLLGTVQEVLKYVLRKINRQDPYPGEQPQPGFWAKEISAK